MSNPGWDPQQPYGQQPPYGQPGYGQGWQPTQPPFPPQHGYGGPSVSPSDERTWSVIAHLGQFVVGVFAPLITYLMYKDRSQFVRWHSVQSLNFGITAVIYSMGAAVIALITCGVGLLLFVPLVIVQVVYLILAGIAASRGEWYRYPKALAIPMVS